jgi:tRNA(Ile)-lysidine synthetase-like protein
MRPRGGQGSRKLQDLLVDAKIPRPMRRHLPVVVQSDGVILWAPGLRPAETGRPGPGTRRWVEFRALPPGDARAGTFGGSVDLPGTGGNTLSSTFLVRKDSECDKATRRSSSG